MSGAAPTGRPIRASDAERHEAVLALSEHFASGRLDHAEFERRMAAATEAVYVRDLDPLFVDLPGVAPVPSTTGAAPGRRLVRGRSMVGAPLWALMLAGFVVAVILTHGFAWWLIFPMWWLVAGFARRRAWQYRHWQYQQWQHHPWDHDRGRPYRSGP